MINVCMVFHAHVIDDELRCGISREEHCFQSAVFHMMNIYEPNNDVNDVINELSMLRYLTDHKLAHTTMFCTVYTDQ
jgi:hypothetical protein